MPARYRDHNALVGNLHPGQPALAEPVVEVIPMRIVTNYQAELDRQRALAFQPGFLARRARLALAAGSALAPFDAFQPDGKTPPMLDRPAADKFDSRQINRDAVRLWPVIRDHIVGLNGRPVGDVLRLSPNYVPQDPGRARPPGSPQLREMRGPSPYEIDGGPGEWIDVGTGKGGPDVISLIEYLGQCDRRRRG